MPGRVGRHQRGALRQREDEDEVEEELERRDPVALAPDGGQARRRDGDSTPAILARESRCRRPWPSMLARLRPGFREAGAVAYPFVESPNKTRASGRAIDVVVMHTMEIAERRRRGGDLRAVVPEPGVARSRRTTASTPNTVVQCVREKDIAWHARGGNTNSIGVELAGFARQTTRDWEDDYSRAVLARAASARRRRLPPQAHPRALAPRRRPGRRARRGSRAHAEVSRAYRRSDHWDPGPGFPIEAFLDRVRAAQQGAPLDDRSVER